MAAAAQLFSKHGVDDTTIAAIAAAAGVSAATVYAQFQSKVGVLEALTSSVLFGGRYEGLAERAQDIASPEEAMAVTASIARSIYENEHTELGLVRGTSGFSPVLRTIEARFEQLRFDLQKERALRIWKATPRLRAMGLDRIRDVLWMYTSRDIYRMLVIEKRWSADAYETWLAETLVRVFLG